MTTTSVMSGFILIILYSILNVIICENVAHDYLPPKIELVSPLVNSSLFQTFKYGRGVDINSNDTIHLRCEGVKELDWKYPDNLVVSIRIESADCRQSNLYVNKPGSVGGTHLLD